MVWFTSNIGAVLLHGRLVGDETGLWFAVIVLFVAIFMVGGGLLAFLVRIAKETDRPAAPLRANVEEFACLNGNHRHDR